MGRPMLHKGRLILRNSNGAGRKLSLTDSRIEQARASMRTYGSEKISYSMMGISKDSWFRWKRTGSQIRDRVEQLEDDRESGKEDVPDEKLSDREMSMLRFFDSVELGKAEFLARHAARVAAEAEKDDGDVRASLRILERMIPEEFGEKKQVEVTHELGARASGVMTTPSLPSNLKSPFELIAQSQQNTHRAARAGTGDAIEAEFVEVSGDE